MSPPSTASTEVIKITASVALTLTALVGCGYLTTLILGAIWGVVLAVLVTALYAWFALRELAARGMAR